MKVQRTLPPAAALLKGRDLLHGAAGIVFPGQYQEKLEQGLREYFGTRHVFLVSSGKAALAVVLKALAKLAPDRREVLIPAYTCWSVPSAVVKAGLSVAACDIVPDTFDFDHSRLARSVTGNTLCIVSGNLFGIPSDIDAINKVAKAKGSFVVEDAAQAMGVTAKGRKVGTRGDVGFFSLGRGKNITCGGGGIIVTDNDKIAEAVAREHAPLPRPGRTAQIGELAKAVLLTLFIRPWLYWLPAGLPFLKLGETFFYHDFPVEAGSGLQAGLLWQWKQRLETSNRKRSENSAAIAADLGLTGSPAAQTSCLRFPVLLRDRETRDRVAAASREAGLGLAAMYPAAICGVAELKETFAGKSFPAAESTAERLITLPTHELTAAADRRRMVEVVRGA